MELERSLPTLRKKGLGVTAVSYDSPQLIRHFAERKGGFSYPLLADPESKVIAAFGVRNPNFPESSPGFGMASPGTLVVDADGVVQSKYFEAYHRQRYTAETVLFKELGVGGSKSLQIKNDHLSLEAYVTQDEIRPGNRILLVVDIELPPGMHLYAPGVEGYRPLALELAEQPMLQGGDTVLPEAEMLHLPAIDETVPVFKRRLRMEKEITVSPRLRQPEIALEATLAYQACDEEVCHLPAELALSLPLKVDSHDVERVPEELRRGSSGR